MSLVVSFIHSFGCDTQHARHVHAMCHLDHHTHGCTAVCFKTCKCVVSPSSPVPPSWCAASSLRYVAGANTHDVLWERAVASLPTPLGDALRIAELDDPEVLGEYPRECVKVLQEMLGDLVGADGASSDATSFSSSSITYGHRLRGGVRAMGCDPRTDQNVVGVLSPHGGAGNPHCLVSDADGSGQVHGLFANPASLVPATSATATACRPGAPTQEPVQSFLWPWASCSSSLREGRRVKRRGADPRTGTGHRFEERLSFWQVSPW